MSTNKMLFDGVGIDLTTNNNASPTLILSGYTAHNSSGDKITGTGYAMSGSTALTTTSTYDIHTKEMVYISDSNLISSNIKSGATVLGVSGSYGNDAADSNATYNIYVSTYYNENEYCSSGGYITVGGSTYSFSAETPATLKVSNVSLTNLLNIQVDSYGQPNSIGFSLSGSNVTIELLDA